MLHHGTPAGCAASAAETRQGAVRAPHALREGLLHGASLRLPACRMKPRTTPAPCRCRLDVAGCRRPAVAGCRRLDVAGCRCPAVAGCRCPHYQFCGRSGSLLERPS
eukprot:364398-Chlamydomonas_euryale.AAC.8